VRNTNGMWIIEGENFKSGGLVQWDTPYRLKHFISGLYLSVTESYNNKSYKQRMSVIDKPDETTLFTFERLKSGLGKKDPYLKKYIKKDSFVIMKNLVSDMYLDLKDAKMDNYDGQVNDEEV